MIFPDPCFSPYPDVAKSGAFLLVSGVPVLAISCSGHHFSHCWSCKAPLVHGSYTFAMLRWCSPLSQWCLSCLITIRYSVIWCYLMLFGHSLVIKRGLLENPYRFFFFCGNIIYSTWVFARGYMGCTWNCGRSLARFFSGLWDFWKTMHITESKMNRIWSGL